MKINVFRAQSLFHLNCALFFVFFSLMCFRNHDFQNSVAYPGFNFFFVGVLRQYESLMEF